MVIHVEELSRDCPDCGEEITDWSGIDPITGMTTNTVSAAIHDSELVLCVKLSCTECDWSDARAWKGKEINFETEPN
jgi:hypothetical protein